MQQPSLKTPGAPPETAPPRRKAAVRTACLGLTGAALQACLGASQQVPSERPAPPPQACPAGAVETMTATLGLRMGEYDALDWSNVRGRSVQVSEEASLRVAGDWLTNMDIYLRGDKVALPTNTRVFGRLYVHEGRVYGRFTEARTPLGVVYPVCMELMDTDGNVGLELQPGSGPGRMMVDPVARLRVVDRFK